MRRKSYVSVGTAVCAPASARRLFVSGVTTKVGEPQRIVALPSPCSSGDDEPALGVLGDQH